MIGSNKEDYKKWQNNMCKLFNVYDLFRIYMAVNKPYKLEWLKLIQRYLSIEDFSYLFGDAWQSIEFPCYNNDVQWIIDAFEASDKQHLMNKEDYKNYLYDKYFNIQKPQTNFVHAHILPVSLIKQNYKSKKDEKNRPSTITSAGPRTR